MENVIVLDNEGTSMDRYTVVIGEDVFGMSDNPLSPNGFNQYAGDVNYLNHGNVDNLVKFMTDIRNCKVIPFDELNDDVKKAIQIRNAE